MGTTIAAANHKLGEPSQTSISFRVFSTCRCELVVAAACGIHGRGSSPSGCPLSHEEVSECDQPYLYYPNFFTIGKCYCFSGIEATRSPYHLLLLLPLQAAMCPRSPITWGPFNSAHA